jgi:hypothetical protein
MKRPAPATVQSVHVPAPTGGLNTVAAGTAIPDGDCIQLVNMVSGEHGLRVRMGAQYIIGVAGRSMHSFVGSDPDGTDDRLFSFSGGQVRSITENPGASLDVFTFGTGSGPASAAGRGVSHAFTTSAGPFLLYCDGYYGYHVYTQSTDSWAAVAEGVGAGQVSGVNPANLAFVMVWKSRVWFVEKDSQNLWYLPAGAIYGVATKLALAQSAQFRQGGSVVGLWNWTLDGGSGIDDFLVAATSGGDVAVYQGTDPASATTFALKGTWSAGALVAGNKVGTNFGGDVLLLTKSGLRPLSQLVSGGDGQQTFTTGKIANLFAKLAMDRGDLPGWDMCIHPEEGVLLITVPIAGADENGDYVTEQLAMSLWNRSWSRFNLPIQAMVTHKRKFYFTDFEDQTWKGTGFITKKGSTLTAIQWGLLTAFTTMGNAGRKQVQLSRPIVLSDSTMNTVRAEARYDYNLAGIADQTEGSATGNVWDVALWDAGTWGDEYMARRHTQGATGMGSTVAISIKGTSRSRTVLVGVDVAFKQGGSFL